MQTHFQSSSTSSIFYSPSESPCDGRMVPLNIFPCQVCGQPAHGNHFRAISCRACAAFFRRASTGAKTIYKCKKENACEIWENGRFKCKKCRLDKCNEVGMDPGRFQFDRDPISATEQFTNTKQASRMTFIPETVEHFLGRPHFIIFVEPPTYQDKNFIDCQYLIEKASHLLELGAEKPLFAKNNLQRLALGLNLVRVQPASTHELQVLTKLGKDEALTYWETDFLAVARWLTYFDDFQLLPHAQQVLLLKSVWHVWSRLDKLSLTATFRRQNFCEKRQMMLGWNSVCDPRTVELDISWFTKYPREQLAFFGFPDEVEDWMVGDALEPLMELQPSDIELTYMLCQLCFHYAGKKYQGEILEVTEKFQEILANELHNYYTNELHMPRYCGRLNQMLKINNIIQQDIWEKRAKAEFAKIFDVYCIEFSHPEMFEDAS
uniref:NR LBD domain-containing protein n=1 Tax=Caenorhabditis tropicalis TaxID=1561998 RepID=A0A1I7V231_9PELO